MQKSGMICWHSCTHANKSTYFAVKTPNGLTEKTNITNNILRGDVLAPLLSTNMVDKYIGYPAMKSENVFLYKEIN